MPVSQKVRRQSRSKVSRQIDRISRLPSKARADAKDQEEQRQRGQRPRPQVVVVFQRKDHEHQDRTGDELGEELARLGHEFGRVRAEYPRGRVLRVARHGANIGPPFKRIDGRLVVAVDDGRTAHGPEHLRQHVGGKLAPGELAKHAVGERHSRVEMRARYPADVDAQHDAQSEAIN